MGNRYAAIESHSHDNAKLQYSGLQLNSFKTHHRRYSKKNAVKIEDGDHIALTLNLIIGEFTAKVNNGEEFIVWKWAEVEKNLRYRLWFCLDNSHDDHIIQIL